MSEKMKNINGCGIRLSSGGPDQYFEISESVKILPFVKGLI